MTSNLNWESILNEKRALETESKRRSMIFQYEAKREIETFLGLPEESTDVAWVLWDEIRLLIKKFEKVAEDAYEKRDPVFEKIRKRGRIRLCDIYCVWGIAHPEKVINLRKAVLRVIQKEKKISKIRQKGT